MRNEPIPNLVLPRKPNGEITGRQITLVIIDEWEPPEEPKAESKPASCGLAGFAVWVTASWILAGGAVVHYLLTSQ